MRNPGLVTALCTVLILLGILVASCGREGPTEVVNFASQQTKNLTPLVRQYADFHNREVQLLVQRHRDDPAELNDIESHLEQMKALNPTLALGKADLEKAREIWRLLQLAHPGGNPSLEITGLLNRALDHLQTQGEVRPEVHAGLTRAVALLLAEDAAGLRDCLLELQLLADNGGNRVEKEGVGVFLGSLERNFGKRNEDPSAPWFWPWVISQDIIGTFFINLEFGTLCSALAEIRMSSIFLFWP